MDAIMQAVLCNLLLCILPTLPTYLPMYVTRVGKSAYPGHSPMYGKQGLITVIETQPHPQSLFLFFS